MKKGGNITSQGFSKKIRPALTPEARENQFDLY